MNEAFEVEIGTVKTSLMDEAFDLVLGIEKKHTLTGDDFMDVGWQVVYARVLVDDRWFFLPHELYDEIEELYGEKICEKLWTLTARI